MSEFQRLNLQPRDIATIVVHEDPLYRSSKLTTCDSALGLHINVMAMGEGVPGLEMDRVSALAEGRLLQLNLFLHSLLGSCTREARRAMRVLTTLNAASLLSRHIVAHPLNCTFHSLFSFALQATAFGSTQRVTCP